MPASGLKLRQSSRVGDAPRQYGTGSEFTYTDVDLHAEAQIQAKEWSSITQQVKDALAEASV